MKEHKWNDVAKWWGSAASCILLNGPVVFYLHGLRSAVIVCGVILGPFVLQSVLIPFRSVPPFRSYFAKRSFDGIAFRFILGNIAFFLYNLLSLFSPRTDLYSGGFLFGLLCGIMAATPYGTFDHPDTPDRKYWIAIGPALAIPTGLIIYFAFGRSASAAASGGSAAIALVVGLWIGLFVDNKIRAWIYERRPTFQLIRRMATPLMAFGAGYVSIIVIFGTFFAADWRMEGVCAFTGMSAAPPASTFMYFSLVTATTVGYGDIVPRSAVARCLAGAETLISIAWTLVVFAAMATRFSEVVRNNHCDPE